MYLIERDNSIYRKQNNNIYKKQKKKNVYIQKQSQSHELHCQAAFNLLTFHLPADKGVRQATHILDHVKLLVLLIVEVPRVNHCDTIKGLLPP